MLSSASVEVHTELHFKENSPRADKGWALLIFSLSRGACHGGSESAGGSDANFVIKTDDPMTTCKPIPPYHHHHPPLHPSTPIPAKLIWWQSGSWLITLVNIFHFRSLSQMTTGCHWLKAIFLKGGAFAKYQMKMIPLSAWVSLSVGALLIGLEYIAAAVVTAASNISPLLRLSSSLQHFPCHRLLWVIQRRSSCADSAAILGVTCGKCEVSLVPTQIRECLPCPNVSWRPGCLGQPHTHARTHILPCMTALTKTHHCVARPARSVLSSTRMLALVGKGHLL